MKRTVIITGASRGIGKAAAELFARHGDHVLINYRHSEEMAHALVNNLKNQGYSAACFQADVSKRREVDLMVEFCREKFGKIHVLVNNAGISESKLFTDITEEEWDIMLNTNLKGVFNCTQSVLKQMIPQKEGVIINVSSIWGLAGGSCEVHYSAAKAGIIGLTKALAKEVGPSNIRVNCVAPGVIQTDMMNGYDETTLEELKNQTPLLKLGQARDVASAIFYLASEEARFITGHVLNVTGGFVV
ncbi:elongation factor P 5-aminopentanone reductase [Candidatus Formimonas warabiya]|uniref:3-ketoacyl-ACP reductase n=1 Tax=Formimonas warabiya TaxID=1761012 RepID=A0A3G1KYN7_FORW1|nr:3-oxoacyl-ACP reductase FabG [Candidatus Formimonas warabiya]ATW27606.1 3-ketoacyl-ACP reductase [Candidatus Formimonas warabiya]